MQTQTASCTSQHVHMYTCTLRWGGLCTSLGAPPPGMRLRRRDAPTRRSPGGRARVGTCTGTPGVAVARACAEPITCTKSCTPGAINCLQRVCELVCRDRGQEQSSDSSPTCKAHVQHHTPYQRVPWHAATIPAAASRALCSAPRLGCGRRPRPVWTSTACMRCSYAPVHAIALLFAHRLRVRLCYM